MATVNLVNNDDRTQALFQSLFQHKAGLGHWAFVGINNQNTTVYHAENPFYFSAEVSVSRGINNINQGVFVTNRCIFRKNCNASFPLQIIGVHDTIRNVFAFAENAGLFEESVNKGGFTVVNVGDNGDVTNWERHRWFG